MELACPAVVSTAIAVVWVVAVLAAAGVSAALLGFLLLRIIPNLISC